MWVRGLKHSGQEGQRQAVLSHSVWVRGLKHSLVAKESAAAIVALRVGAWIETHYLLIILKDILVALRVGAWIETKLIMPSQESSTVALRVGAWIETIMKRR